MSAVLEELIIDAKRLLKRVRAHYTTAPEALPPDQQLTVAELDSWYEGVGALLERTFGPDSVELRMWREWEAELRKRRGARLPPGESIVVEALAESIGTLTKIKVSRIGTRSDTAYSTGFASLHPTVVARSGRLFEAGKYDDAVFVAFKAVEEEVRRRSGADDTDIGVNLISKVMSPKSPKLSFSNIEAEREAFHSLFRGAIGAFKNPLSHRSVNHTDPVRVFELLVFASSLMRLLDDLPEVN
jgi:uncharacterized protein (TIGR02391 family)